MWPFKKKQKMPVAPDIRIAGIYVVCRKVGLRKCEVPKDSHRFLVEMTSGKHAVYKYKGFEHPLGVDWLWYDFAFERYATEADDGLPRYC